MSAPAGWYPDPQHPVPGAPPQQRYWDGQAWTAHVAPTAQPTYPQPTYPQPTQAQPSRTQPAYGHYPAYAAQPAGPPTTPDGTPLAGWWHRVGAYVIDSLVQSVIVAILGFPLIRKVFRAFGDFIDEAMTAAENGSATPSTTRFELDIVGPVLALTLIALAVSLVYTIAFLLWKQATPGKLAVGLRVRLRESPDLPLSAVLLRWVAQVGGPGVLGLVPLVGTATALYSLVNSLWPLWDDHNQALHDKVAKTNVVRTR